MKKITILLGTLAMVLAFGLTVVSCGEEESDPAPAHDTKLVAKWYDNATAGTLQYEFKADGTYEAGGTAIPNATWTTSGANLIISSSGVQITTVEYKLDNNDKELTFKAGTGTVPTTIIQGKYYKH